MHSFRHHHVSFPLGLTGWPKGGKSAPIGSGRRAGVARGLGALLDG
jgi:hypothetical protein